MESAPPGTMSSFSLRGRPGAITLENKGFHHPDSARAGPLLFTPYADVTHLASSQRALWIGTRLSTYVIARRSFVDADGPENVVRALLDRIASHPDGVAQLARMAEIEEVARAAPRPRAVWGLTALCVAVYLLGWVFGGDVFGVGQYSPALVADGDWWRLITGNLLHAGWIHLLLNLMGLTALGPLLEHSLGTARTLVVMVASGLGGLLASGWFSAITVVGVSGVICGLLGALLWLELRRAERLPAWWRVPRRALYWMTGATALLGLLPFIAGWAHAGGFFAGAVVAAALTGRHLEPRPAAPQLRVLAGASVALCALALGAAGWQVGQGDYTARQTVRLGRLPGATPEQLNEAAWTIAIDPDSTTRELEEALRLAQRSVDETGRRVPAILDTLAEVHFRLGQRGQAIAVIEEAIRLAPFRPYYREQRERFLGQRPESPPPWEEPATPPEPERDWGTPGLTV